MGSKHSIEMNLIKGQYYKKVFDISPSKLSPVRREYLVTNVRYYQLSQPFIISHFNSILSFLLYLITMINHLSGTSHRLPMLVALSTIPLLIRYVKSCRFFHIQLIAFASSLFILKIKLQSLLSRAILSLQRVIAYLMHN